MHSATKLKKQKVQNWVNSDIFLNKVLGNTLFWNTVLFHLLKLVALKTSGLKF